MSSYLRSFVIGSSWLALAPFFLTVSKLKNKNYTMDTYAMVAPLYLGLMTMLACYLRKKYKFSLRKSLLIVSLISPLIVYFISTKWGTYDFVERSRTQYLLTIMASHFILFNVVIYFLEKNVAGYKE